MLSGHIADLRGLIIDDVARVAEVVINELLVLNVDERGQEDDAVGDKSKTPQRDEFDEPVADEGGEEGLKIG